MYLPLFEDGKSQERPECPSCGEDLSESGVICGLASDVWPCDVDWDGFVINTAEYNPDTIMCAHCLYALWSSCHEGHYRVNHW